jgi:hypothetical protein
MLYPDRHPFLQLSHHIEFFIGLDLRTLGSKRKEGKDIKRKILTSNP